MANFTMIRRCLLVSLLLVASAECGETTTLTVQPDEIKPNAGLVPYILGLPVTISRALDRIRQSTRNYRLMDDIWFEVIPENTGDVDTKKSASKSPPRNLVEQADAVFDTHRLSWHNAIVQGLDLNIYKDQMQRYTFDIIKQTQNANDLHVQDTRTFGLHRRRLQLVMLPVMYKLGVITTLLIGLTVLSVKGVTIGVLLLVLAVAGVVAKVSKYHQHYGPYAAAAAYTHDPYDRVASQHQLLQQPPVSHEKNIHVHVHTAPGSSASLSSWPNRGNNHAMLKSPLVYDGAGRPPTGDDNANYGPYYWNRNNEDYYDSVTNNDNSNNYRLDNRRRVGNSNDVESTTNSVYPWLG